MTKNTFADGLNTTDDWNALESTTCILPVGSFEQHGHHLPLATDALLAEYFARHIAHSIHAALLPVLSVFTSYEQSGFRGSFSFRPETAIAIIRDLAEEVQRQHFDTLIIVNFHGGNFILTPTVREWNRQDRNLKILLCYPPALADSPAGDIHAGEWETSLMLHLYPDLVRQHRVDVSDQRWINGRFTLADLNTFGIGTVAPEGSMGYPSKASAEKGKKWVQELKTALDSHISERLDWLKSGRDPSDAGNRYSRRDAAQAASWLESNNG